MTINQLIKKLQKLEKECPRNTHVTVDWEEIKDLDYSYAPINKLSVEYCHMADGDGFLIYTDDRKEAMRHVVVLK